MATLARAAHAGLDGLLLVCALEASSALLADVHRLHRGGAACLLHRVRERMRLLRDRRLRAGRRRRRRWIAR